MHGTKNHSSGIPTFRVRFNRIRVGNHSFHVILYIPELFYYYKSEEPTQEEQLQILKEFYENPMGGHQGITRTYR